MSSKKKNPHLKRLSLVRPFVKRLLLGLLFMIITVGIQLLYPVAVSDFIDSLADGDPQHNYTLLAIGMIILLTIYAISTALRYYFFETTGYMVVAKIRTRLHQVLVGKGISFYDRHNIGEITNRLSSDVEVLHDTLTTGLAVALRAFLVCLGGLVLLLITSPMLSLILLVFLPVTMYFAKWVGSNIQKRSKQIQECHAKAGKVAHENFSNIRLVQAFNRQETALRHYDESIHKALDVSKSCARFVASFQGAASLVIYLVLLATLWLGALQIMDDNLTIGELTSFVIYSAMVATSAGALSDFWQNWQRSIGSTERIFEIIDSASISKVLFKELTKSPPLTGKLEFDKVTFFYPERRQVKALQNFSLSIKAGEKIALIGASGAGKSTVARLVLGFYKPQEGELYFDSRSSLELSKEYIRKHSAIVEQDPTLFDGSIFDNIAYGANAEAVLDDVKRVAKQAFADDFIEGFPDGYKTIVGERGVQLSGGQKQRIAIARALLRNPKILILDEATSALDSFSELKVQQALDNLMQGRTTIMIAHRYSTISKADRVIVLENGKIVQQGTHEYLREQRLGTYYHLMSDQLAESHST
ncbi:ABC transporter ATP-binding protein [Kangiella koreensis]|uniref:ABC transporter related n=1 Tax=Kangiella koreensis (strain DSM 16069 / JCM 12317 / KCTC 12182 / SW-125) TaxID=523791 RepID=C7RCI6_KANKD|nr:ABC transporter transmembrane domain-containing protein [Kangiella koreensis]ACV26978.1 ABC transporter related [Kangiella koreensis DSM 16069]